MKIDDLIKLLEHTKEKLGGNAPVCFLQGYGEKRKVFDFGEQGRDGYCCSITPYETYAWIDPAGRFAIPIREIIEPKEMRTPTKLNPTDKEKALYEKLHRWIVKQYTEGYCDWKTFEK